MTDLRLTSEDQATLNGERGAAAGMAMAVLVRFCAALGAGGLLDIARTHIDGCLYHGQAGLDFVDRLVALGGKVQVPTTLNVGSVDLIHPELMRVKREDESPMRRLMSAHLALGCAPTFTCAPYQTRFRPRFGEQIAWGESNAIIFANSVIGARTNRYGDFIDLCCALTGRAPAWGLHLDANRRGQILYEIVGLSASLAASDSLYVAVGLVIGEKSGDHLPVINGLPPPRDEDQLKALGAAAASAGSVAMFHAVGITPEAATVGEAFGGRTPDQTIAISEADLAQALARLSKVPDGSPISAVSLGTPHFSLDEWRRLIPLLRRYRPQRNIPIYVNTGRDTLSELDRTGELAELHDFGVRPVADTCTYVTAILKEIEGVVMTNSGKWAYYAPGNIGVTVAFGELEDCVRSAAAGRVTRGS
ncbi:aconitase X [Aestuariivirga sp. YIM B02566]|uniref:Aconitase X catalytic domain-containing protein n=1 Tax=Taklimakanibacter albus TaxID=2800327 RepID=A0ACC5R9U6_9HYPH|nr:aconitase X catalytic domain-containing protein [Aestuariivirga sp. YIM B02566]